MWVYVLSVAATALGGTILLQNAFGLAPLYSSFPVLVTVEPLTGLLLGVLVLEGALRVSPSAYAGEVGGLIVMAIGVALAVRICRRVLRHRWQQRAWDDLVARNRELDRFLERIWQRRLLTRVSDSCCGHPGQVADAGAGRAPGDRACGVRRRALRPARLLVPARNSA